MTILKAAEMIKHRLENFRPGFSPIAFKALLLAMPTVAFVLPLALLAIGTTEFFNDMAVQDKARAQMQIGRVVGGAEAAERVPPEGTVPRGYEPYAFAGYSESGVIAAGGFLENPVAPTMAILERGRERYGIYCSVCHGAEGLGDGLVVEKGYPAPPSLADAKGAVRFPDGRIFHLIMEGRTDSDGMKMPYYRGAVSERDAWSIVYYVRALQRARNPGTGETRE